MLSFTGSLAQHFLPTTYHHLTLRGSPEPLSQHYQLLPEVLQFHQLIHDFCCFITAFVLYILWRDMSLHLGFPFRRVPTTAETTVDSPSKQVGVIYALDFKALIHVLPARRGGCACRGGGVGGHERVQDGRR